MNETRLIDIETKLAYQDDLIEEMNKTLYRQQQQIERLEAICEALAGQLRALHEAGNERAPAHERPPHY